MIDIFKTFVHTSKDTDMADFLLPISKKILDKSKSNNDYKNGKTSYYSPDIVENHMIELRPFCDYIRKNVLKYLTISNFDTENLSVDINGLWFSEMNKGGYHASHSHNPGSQISGNFYITADNQSGHLRFYRQEYHNNIFYKLKIKDYNEYNNDTYTFKPEKGLMCIWRSDLVHGVDYNKSDSRIAVSFNVTVDYL